jgi:S1-C subfamily serine protease
MVAKRFVLAVALLALLPLAASAQGIVGELQGYSVTVKADGAQGSGTIITRKIGDRQVNFVWTAGHVVDGLRRTREYVDPKTGSKKTVIEFADAAITQEYRQDGRRVGEANIDAKVLKYSDADTGEDLALLQVRKYDFLTGAGAKFYLDKEIPPLGTELYHVGSLLGQDGHNSLTSGIISQHGRVFNLSGSNGVIFDQTTATAFPGSSGGGMFLKADGRYVGMLVRGAGEGFNFMVPIRRIQDWAKRVGVEWALDPNVKAPDEETLAKMTVEDSGVTQSGEKSADAKAYPTLLRLTDSYRQGIPE